MQGGNKKKNKTSDDGNVRVAKTGDGDGEVAATKESNTTMKRMPEKKERTVDDKSDVKEKDHTLDPALNEPGSWICPGCKNHNFASRNACHSKTCDEKRPAGIPVPPRFQHPTAKPRHDPDTSKTMKWAEQASTDTVENNQALRKRYKETGGEGMTQADVTRAKLLLERDERKKQKKELKKKKKGVK